MFIIYFYQFLINLSQQIFATNAQGDDVGVVPFPTAVFSRFIRFELLTKVSTHNRYNMRFELLGCEDSLNHTHIARIGKG